MGRTRTQLRQLTARQLGLPFVSGTSTASSATTLTAVAELSYYADSELVGAAVYLPDATVKDRVVTGFVQSTGVATFRPSSSGGMDGTDSYELLPFPATAIHQAIDEALLALYDQGLLVRPLWLHGVTGSPIYNADMAYWTTSALLDGWTVATSTLSQQTGAAAKWIGESAARIGTANGYLTLDAKWARYLADLEGQSVRLHAWLRASATGNNRVSMLEDGSSVKDSGVHSGDSDWHLVSTDSYTLTAGETDISIRIERAGGNVDCSFLWLEHGAGVPSLHPIPIALMPDGPTEILLSPLGFDDTNRTAYVRPRNASPVGGWDFVRYHDEALDVETGVIVWRTTPPAGRMMWIQGAGPLTLPTADTGVVELDQTESLLVAKAAAIILLERNMYRGGARWAERVARLARDVQALSEGHGSSRDSASLGPDW
ncbi:MAG TPA: hypothetical protein ACFYED_00130 [Candidatus Tripitaka californicus]|uniref:hypothetical protein n=1 Tax=Candidatus Tripitaka californicus TaxID=3367616 RepID=UPI00402532BD